MINEHRSDIEAIVKELSCDKDVRCMKSGLKDLCKAKDIGSDSYLECLEGNPHLCNYSSLAGSSYHCKCPLRIYLIKTLHV